MSGVDPGVLYVRWTGARSRPGSAFRPLLPGGGRGGCGQASRNRASALPEAILVRSAG
jgi:hypothetical protein